MTSIPNGIVTFLFTDVEGSTKLAQEFPKKLQVALESHRSIMKEAIESNNGFVFEIIGDAFCCAFGNADDAIKAAVDAQLNLQKEKWDDVRIKIRIGIHSGKAEWNGKRYIGYITLARAARVMSAAYGEQILISNDTYKLCISKLMFGNENIENDTSFRDLGERRLKDLKQPVRLYQIVSDGLVLDFPPLKTLDARPNNLPVQLTSFIGREAEMKQVKDLLKQTHLLTLVGSGGAGKTRLAIEVAADIIDDFANGVWLVEFASLLEPVLLPQTIAQALGVKEESKISLEDTLCSYLKEKEILIILDNCEHLIDACAKISEKLLQNSPKLKILATSREALKCSGEQIYIVPSLKIPEFIEDISAEKLMPYEAVQLFIERALAVKLNFTVNNENAPALAQICYQLDGIPLAIELAAASVKVLSVEEILENLKDRFGLLTGGRRTALPRQQTLLSLIDWSYDLLSEKEKLLLQRLSVFKGGCTLEGASEICSDKKIERNEIFGLLTNLVDKSLVSPMEEDGKSRYNILETIHHYALEKLGDSPELQKKHFDYFLKLAEESEIKFTGSEQLKWLKIIEKDLDNIRAALTRASKTKSELTLRMSSAMGEFWDVKSYYSEGLEFLLTAINEIKNCNDIYKANTLYLAGLFSIRMGRYTQAKSFLHDSLKLSQKINYSKGIGNSLLAQGTYEINLGHYKKTEELYERSLLIFRELNHKVGIAKSLINFGVLNRFLGNLTKSEKYYYEALEIYRELGNLQQIALTTFHIGYIAYYKDGLEKAKKIFEENLSILKTLGDKYYIAKSIQQLGIIAFAQNDYVTAKKFSEEGLQMFREIGNKSKIPIPLFYLAKIFFLEGNKEEGKLILKESINTCKEVGSKILLCDCVLVLAGIVYAQGKKETTAKLIGKNESMRKNIGQASVTLDTEIEPTLSDLKSYLGKEKFNQLLEEGEAMTFDEAVNLALSELS